MIERDFICKAEDKFYNLIVAIRGVQELSAQQISYGKDNLENPSEDFLEYLEIQLNKNKKILEGLVGEEREKLQEKISEEKALYERLRVKR